MRPYYEAYDERYKAVHEKGVSWSSDQRTPIVLQTLEKYGVDPDAPVLEIGCGEGRDAGSVLERGYRLLATDVSGEAISYCRAAYPKYAAQFQVLDCLRDAHPARYGFLYAVAVIHMLVPDADRDAFYAFIREHLTDDGLALICTMGDGETELQTDPATAFELQERSHESGKMIVAGTSCRMVSFETFEDELARNGLQPVELGITESLPDFDSLMYAVVRRIPKE